MLTAILLSVVTYFLYQNGIVPDWLFYTSIVFAGLRILFAPLILLIRLIMD